MSRYASLPNCLPYHPESELIGRSGYYPNISKEQIEAVNTLCDRLQRENVTWNSLEDEDEFLKLLRFLRARAFDVDKAFQMLRDDVQWREEEDRLKLRNETATDVLNCADLEKMFGYFPTWIQGYDKQLRPVSYRKFGKFEIWNILKLTTMDRLIRFHAWETEQALRKMYDTSHRVGYNIETFVVVVDASGWRMSLATNDAFVFIKAMATTDSNYYPERLGTVIVINAPFALSFAWKIIQTFLDNVTKRKIRILSTDRKEWYPVLLEYIDEEQIPVQYGGLLPDLSPADSLSSMNPSCGDVCITLTETAKSVVLKEEG